jgi:hypothetical protein
VVRRLVQHQHIHAGVDQFREGQSSLLSARQVANMLVNVVAKEKKPGQERSQITRRRRGGRDATQFHDYFVPVVEIFELLSVIADFDFAAPAKLARDRRNLTEDCFQKCGLA